MLSIRDLSGNLTKLYIRSITKFLNLIDNNFSFFQISEFLPWMGCIVGASKLGISTEAIASNCGRIANKIIKTENEIN